MKQTIIIIMLVFVGVQLSAQMSLKDLENRYIEKADALKTDYENKSVSLAKSYVKALEAKEKQIVKSGNLDEALKVRAKIKEIQAVISKVAKSSKTTAIKRITTDPFVGKWQSTRWRGLIQTVSKDAKGYKIHHSQSGTASTAATIIDGKLILSWYGSDTIVLTQNSKGLVYTQYSQKYNGKLPTTTKIAWDKVQMTKVE